MSGAARRYAEALLEAVGHESQEVQDATKGELQGLADAVTEISDLRSALENPSYSSEERLAVLTAVAERLELSPRVRNFARLVVERGRADEFGEMAETFGQLLDARSGRLRALVTSAQPLGEDEAQRIRQALERRTGKTIDVELAVDPSLIGGVRAEVGTIVFDGTIRAELLKLRENLSDA